MPAGALPSCLHHAQPRCICTRYSHAHSCALVHSAFNGVHTCSCALAKHSIPKRISVLPCVQSQQGGYFLCVWGFLSVQEQGWSMTSQLLSWGCKCHYPQYLETGLWKQFCHPMTLVMPNSTPSCVLFHNQLEGERKKSLHCLFCPHRWDFHFSTAGDSSWRPGSLFHIQSP